MNSYATEVRRLADEFTLAQVRLADRKSVFTLGRECWSAASALVLLITADRECARLGIGPVGAEDVIAVMKTPRTTQARAVALARLIAVHAAAAGVITKGTMK